MAEYIVEIDHPELCVEYGATNFTDRLERIVRCKDCKHYKSIVYKDGTETERYCDLFSVNGDSWFEAHEPSLRGFCAWGEEREE